MRIRTATPDDRYVMYDICLRTGAAGADASDRHENPRLLGEVYVGPYLAVSGCVGFVCENQHGVGGYAIGAINTAAFHSECERSWWPSLRQQYPDPGQTARSPDELLIEHIHRPSRPDATVIAHHPAHLHIDLLPRIQGTGSGGRLMRTLLETLRRLHVNGVHLGVDPANDKAIGFYHHCGFETMLDTPGERIMVKSLGELC